LTLIVGYCGCHGWPVVLSQHFRPGPERMPQKVDESMLIHARHCLFLVAETDYYLCP